MVLELWIYMSRWNRSPWHIIFPHNIQGMYTYILCPCERHPKLDPGTCEQKNKNIRVPGTCLASDRNLETSRGPHWTGPGDEQIHLDFAQALCAYLWDRNYIHLENFFARLWKTTLNKWAGEETFWRGSFLHYTHFCSTKHVPAECVFPSECRGCSGSESGWAVIQVAHARKHRRRDELSHAKRQDSTQQLACATKSKIFAGKSAWACTAESANREFAWGEWQDEALVEGCAGQCGSGERPWTMCMIVRVCVSWCLYTYLHACIHLPCNGMHAAQCHACMQAMPCMHAWHNHWHYMHGIACLPAWHNHWHYMHSCMHACTCMNMYTHTYINRYI